MTALDHELARRLDALRQQGLRRELRRVDSAQGPRIEIAGRRLLNFSSNDYLGLADHPALKEAAARAATRWGAGAGASRLICGSLAPHHELEETLAEFKGTGAALSFSSGYATALGTLGALLGKDDIVILDKLVHASLVDAARLSGAKLRVFKHNDLSDLEDILHWATGIRHRGSGVLHPQILIVTESVFSMDGDVAPLREIVELKDRYGAWLLVDEAHSTGLYGERRRGVAEEMGVSERVEIQMGTLGKTLGAAGGYVAGSRVLVDYLVNRARSFIFSTAPVPAAAAAATEAVHLVNSAEGAERCRGLWARVAQWQEEMGLASSRLGAGLAPNLPATGPTPRLPPGPSSAIRPLIIGEEREAVAFSAALLEQGVFAPAIRYPTVAKGKARLRVTLTAAHSDGDVSRFAEAWRAIRYSPSSTFQLPASPHDA